MSKVCVKYDRHADIGISKIHRIKILSIWNIWKQGIQ